MARIHFAQNVGLVAVFVNGKEIDRNTEYFSADKFKAAVERG